MWKINLPKQPSRPPPSCDPIVEAWLDSLPAPAANPSCKELRQWRLANYLGLGRSVFVVCVILRGVSLAIALSVTGIIASIAAGRHGPFMVFQRLVPILVVCPVVALWNTAELVASRFGRNGGINPNIHVVIDGILFLAVATAAGTLLVDVICGLTDFGPRFTTAGQEITSVCLLVVMMVIHSFLLFFFVCNYVEQLRTKSTKTAAGQFPVPQYAHGAAPWSSPLSATASLHRTPTGLESTKFGPNSISVELRNSPSAMRRGPPPFGLSVQPQPTPAVALSSVIESTVIAQAMSGVWDAETGSGQQVGLAPPAYDGPLGSTAADRSSSFDGGRYA